MADEFSELRIDYDSEGLDVGTVPEEPRDLLRAWVHESLAAGDIEPHAMTLSTATPDGAPAARILLLRGLDERGPGAGELELEHAPEHEQIHADGGHGRAGPPDRGLPDRAYTRDLPNPRLLNVTL